MDDNMKLGFQNFMHGLLADRRLSLVANEKIEPAPRPKRALVDVRAISAALARRNTCKKIAALAKKHQAGARIRPEILAPMGLRSLRGIPNVQLYDILDRLSGLCKCVP